ncbi:phosphopantetheine-binding protein [Corallincola spongiicola]|uniref:Acyl carrier protein n=1 Tax=Corallincola spongiicola TaxID=2520508 RepID=A0ABY1WSZ5_9GAMM|nr:phosphopantetheine-binding protein [Corallincola spongiicola]TAA47855.1 acyl carrier protein [Corallincola spongiicola]
MERIKLREMVIEELVNIAPDVEPDDVPDDEDLRDALDLDSMDFMRLVAAVNLRTGITIPEADYRQVLELGQMLDYLLTRMR